MCGLIERRDDRTTDRFGGDASGQVLAGGGLGVAAEEAGRCSKINVIHSAPWAAFPRVFGVLLWTWPAEDHI